ncbi:hypothetical protein [Neptuniibacter halophilus]|uniref:hypothetical protein n=1 Tax=Neptuniibacter halophilus TaxID=651666 RepID=UPI002573C160|nr:hypothetical protein [Neptuniibacter halophilus]
MEDIKLIFASADFAILGFSTLALIAPILYAASTEEAVFYSKLSPYFSWCQRFYKHLTMFGSLILAIALGLLLTGEDLQICSYTVSTGLLVLAFSVTGMFLNETDPEAGELMTYTGDHHSGERGQ